MVRVEYCPGTRAGNHLFKYVAGRLLAQRLGSMFHADPIEGFPWLKVFLPGKIASDSMRILHELDPIPSWPDIEHLRGTSLKIIGEFANSRYYVEDRETIRRWLVPYPIASADPDDLLVNVRLGDFLPGGHAPIGIALGQEYYTSLLERLKFKTLHLMTDEPGHPYLDIFKKYNPTIVTGYGSEHFLKALAFKRIIMSNSTFCWWFTFLSRAEEIYFPMRNGDCSGAWCIGHLPLGIDLRLDWPEVTHVYNIPNYINPVPPITEQQRAEALAFGKRSKTLFL